eukprot:scaffold41194_cov63-Phaeocystis_antarctica.AAC.4
MAERWSAVQSEPCARRDSNPTRLRPAHPCSILTSVWLPACLSGRCFYPSSELIYRTSAPDQWESQALRTLLGAAAYRHCVGGICSLTV